MELVEKNAPTKITPGLDGFIGVFPQSIKENIIPSIHKIFPQKTEEEGILPNSF